MSERILVIDDETNIRTMMKLALEHVGFSVETAGDGKEGLEKYRDGAGFDLVILDQRMPGMAGIDVQKEMYARKIDARVIVITAFGTIDLALEAIHAGASDFLRKPFTAETLRTAVKTALQKAVVHERGAAAGSICREFTRTNINGFNFELDHEVIDERLYDRTCHFSVSSPDGTSTIVAVHLPAYVMELVRAHADSEEVPGGDRFWQAMCEETLANYLWQHAALPPDNRFKVEDVSASLQRWLDQMLTVESI